MRILLFILLSFFPFLVFSQNDTTIYFGVNGEIGTVENADIKKEIKQNLFGKTKVVTSILNDGEWQFLFSEKITVVSDSIYKIRIKGDEFSGRITRHIEKLENGNYKFTDWLDERIKRIGISTSKIPLLFEGEVTDFYENGRIKSISQYNKNKLVTNKNWLPSGKPDVDDIFYSVDNKPLFEDGIGRLHQHILKTFENSDVDPADVSGKIVVGFVVKTNGKIDGIRIVKGITGQVNAVALHAFQTLMGNWKPARLDNRDVNYFQLFPINFIYYQYDFDYLQMKGSMLYWEIN